MRAKTSNLTLVLWGGYLFSLYVAFALLFMPFSDVLAPQAALINQKLLSEIGGVAGAVAFGVGLLLLGTWGRGKVMDRQQAANDRTAQQLMIDLRADPAAPVAEFYLYLRAFETTGRLHVPLYLRLRKFSLGLYRLETGDLESYVSNAVGRAAPMVAMGRPGEAVGAGRIAAQDADWEADIAVLMKRATGILLIPSHRPGTLWEMDRLKAEGILDKVIFVMPPRARGQLDTEERWEAARKIMADHGLDAPAYEDRGLLFEVDPAGRSATSSRC